MSAASCRSSAKQLPKPPSVLNINIRCQELQEEEQQQHDQQPTYLQALQHDAAYIKQ
jgi:hypothetical protein